METKAKSTPVAAAAAGKVYKAENRVGRGMPDITGIYTKRCSCKRDKTIVFCRACGYYCNGRIRLKCEQHPRVTFLLDISECPKCHSSVFLDEYVKCADVYRRQAVSLITVPHSKGLNRGIIF